MAGPSPRASCSPAASCSCRGCAARGRRPSRPWAPWPEAGSWKCASHTRPRTPKGAGLASLPPRASFRAPPRRVRRPGGTFFERQTQALEGAAHAGRRDRHAVLVVEELAVLLQCEVGVVRDLSGQRLLQHPTLPGGWPRHGPGFHVSRLPAQPQVAPDGRRRHAEDPHDLRPGHPAVDGRKHLRSKILRVRFPAAKSRTPLNLYANICQARLLCRRASTLRRPAASACQHGATRLVSTLGLTPFACRHALALRASLSAVGIEYGRGELARVTALVSSVLHECRI